MTDESGEAGIVRVDRYTITVDGCRVCADERQERAIRAMSARQRADFLNVMGGRVSGEADGE